MKSTRIIICNSSGWNFGDNENITESDARRRVRNLRIVRDYEKQHGIRMTAAPKGPKKNKTAYQKRKERIEYGERNHIEGRIGNAKQALSLNQIKAKLKDTSTTWIAATIFVLNLSAFAAKSGETF